MSFDFSFDYPQILQTTDLGSGDIKLTNVNRFKVSLFTGSNSSSADLGSVAVMVSSNGNDWSSVDFGKNKVGPEVTITSNLGSTPMVRLVSFYVGSLVLSKMIVEYKGENYYS